MYAQKQRKEPLYVGQLSQLFDVRSEDVTIWSDRIKILIKTHF